MSINLPGISSPFVAAKHPHIRLFGISTFPDGKKNHCQSVKSLFFLSPDFLLENSSEKFLTAHQALPQPPAGSKFLPIDHNVFLAKSYARFDAKPVDLLWKLHLRHGHRNFVDIARQYNLPLPASIPACSSCLLGKGHAQPHQGGNFERATRVGQGFHADFKGPYQVPTPQGFLYLLIIVDDFSKRVFPFLVKSQDEWLEVWRSFVAQIEAELGSNTSISWLLTDFGTVFRSATMTSYCFQKGIQQRFAAPGAQWMDGTAERTLRTGRWPLPLLFILDCQNPCGVTLLSMQWRL